MAALRWMKFENTFPREILLEIPSLIVREAKSRVDVLRKSGAADLISPSDMVVVRRLDSFNLDGTSNWWFENIDEYQCIAKFVPSVMWDYQI